MTRKSSYPVGDETSYQSFLSRENPDDLREEIALQRSLLRDLLTTFKSPAEENAQILLEDLRVVLKRMGVEPSNVDALLTAFGEPVRTRLALLYPSGVPSAKDLAAIGKVIEGIAATVEKQDRIRSRAKLKVELDIRLLQEVLREVMPFIPLEQYPAVAARLRGKFRLSTGGESPVVPASIQVVESTVVPVLTL